MSLWMQDPSLSPRLQWLVYQHRDIILLLAEFFDVKRSNIYFSPLEGR